MVIFIFHYNLNHSKENAKIPLETEILSLANFVHLSYSMFWRTEAKKLLRITFITAYFIHSRTTSFSAMTERKGLHQKVSDQVANDLMIKRMSNGSTLNFNGCPYFWCCFVPFEHWSSHAWPFFLDMYCAFETAHWKCSVWYKWIRPPIRLRKWD